MTQYQTQTIPTGIITFEGGLNTGNLNLQSNESNDLANVEFDKFGSLHKRHGYCWLNTNTIPTLPLTEVRFDSCGTAFGTEVPPVNIRITTKLSTVIT